MKFQDLTGKKFLHSTVLYRMEDHISKSGRKKVRWHCLCDCGNEFNIIGDNLKSHPETTCRECANKNRSEHNRINVLGKKYGRLTILESIPGTSPTKVKCKCDCGNDYIGLQANVINGHTQSCGCLQAERASISNTKNWTGYTSDYGVEFIRQAYMNKKGQWVWECRCGICGGLFYELPAKVNNGHTTSCGCRIQSSGEEYIQSLLSDSGINFKPQYTFDDCKYTYVLRFDFAIIENNKVLGLIEYDGKQHFKPIEFFGGGKGFIETKKRDEIKSKYCQLNKIPLLRLPYTLSAKEIKEKIDEYYLSLTTAG